MYGNLWFSLKAILQTLTILLRLTSTYQDSQMHIKHAYFSRFLAPGNKNRRRQRK